MAIVAYTTAELRLLEKFITTEVAKRRTEPSKLHGVASGGILNLLRLHNPELGRKVRDRSEMVSVAKKLGFTINAGIGGGRAGPCIWEFIDLPPQKTAGVLRA